MYYRSLDTGEVFYNYSGKMPAGDLIRPYVAAAVLAQVENKDLALDEVYTLRQRDIRTDSPALGQVPAGSQVTVQNLLEDMLLQNDRTALYKLIWIAGREDINAWLTEKDTWIRWWEAMTCPSKKTRKISWGPGKTGTELYFC